MRGRSIRTDTCTRDPLRYRLFLAVMTSVGLGLLIASPTYAKTAIPARPPGYPIVDEMGILSRSAVSTLEALDRRLGAEKSNAEIGVLIISSTDGEDPNTFATRAFNTWKLGSSTLNNGALIMVAKDDRKVQLILGDGVDNNIQRSAAQSIVSEYVLPEFRKGDFEAGVLIGASETASRILGLVEPVAVSESTVLGSAVSDTAASDSAASDSGEVADSFDADANLIDETTPEIQPVADSGGSGSNTGWFLGGLAGVGGVGAAGVAGVRSLMRRRPRKCKKCRTIAVLLGEVADDASLAPGQRTEERVGSVDYDVWDCPACDGVEVLRYGKLFTRYKQCPSCGAKTKSSSSSTVTSATEYSTGLARIEESCANCSFKNTYTRVIPRVTPSSSSSSSSSSSFSSSSSSRGGGGGHSSGGGGGGSW